MKKTLLTTDELEEMNFVLPTKEEQKKARNKRKQMNAKRTGHLSRRNWLKAHRGRK